MSKREEIRKKKQQQSRQQMLIIAGVIVVIAVAVAGYLIYQNYQNTLPVAQGSYTTVPTQTWPQADGKALGRRAPRCWCRNLLTFNAPSGGEFFHGVEPQLIKDYVAAGKIRYEFHHYIVIDKTPAAANHSTRPRPASAPTSRPILGTITIYCIRTRAARGAARLPTIA